jgi:hypothetical protein
VQADSNCYKCRENRGTSARWGHLELVVGNEGTFQSVAVAGRVLRTVGVPRGSGGGAELLDRETDGASVDFFVVDCHQTAAGGLRRGGRLQGSWWCCAGAVVCCSVGGRVTTLSRAVQHVSRFKFWTHVTCLSLPALVVIHLGRGLILLMSSPARRPSVPPADDAPAHATLTARTRPPLPPQQE